MIYLEFVVTVYLELARNGVSSMDDLQVSGIV